MTEPVLFHIIDRSRWQQALADGTYAPESLTTEGFVHCSYVDQVEPVANALYRDATDMVVVELDPVLLDVPVLVEDTYGSGTSFPHVYGPIRVRAQVGEHALTRDADGRWTLAR